MPAFCRTCFVAVLLTAMPIAAAKGPSYTDPEKTDADFALQGEYAGSFMTKDGERKYGVQVIALGKGEFTAVGYAGGLPGDGWNGKEPMRVNARASEGALSISVGDKGTGEIKNGVLTGRNTDGEVVGALKKVRRKSPTLGQKPPQGAIVLFDGSDTKQWKKGRMEDGLLMQGTTSVPTFGSHKLHIEFRLPYQPEDRGQGRGNSGIYVQGRYECQMLDSFGLAGQHNECGGLYSVKDPDLNMCFPPLAWQTYDLDFTAAKFDDQGKLTANPRVTIRHNGVLIHEDVELPGERSTTAAPAKPGPEPGPIYLQDHGCAVRYRNIWVVPTDS